MAVPEWVGIGVRMDGEIGSENGDLVLVLVGG